MNSTYPPISQAFFLRVRLRVVNPAQTSSRRARFRLSRCDNTHVFDSIAAITIAIGIKWAHTLNMMYTNLTEDENALLTHISMWGSTGYPVRKLGRGWTWEFRSIKSAPGVFTTKKDAIASFEAYHQMLIDRAAGRGGRLIPETVCSEFRANLASAGDACGKTPEQVYALWHEYSEACCGYDQSAIWSEFVDWYKAKLMPPVAGVKIRHGKGTVEAPYVPIWDDAA